MTVLVLQGAALTLLTAAAIGTASAVRDAWRRTSRRVDALADPAPLPDDRRWP